VSLSSTPFDFVHCDIWGPAPIPIEGGSCYFVVFIDDYSCYTWIYLLQHRSELTQVYQNFHKMVQTQFSRTIKIFRSDNAMEFNEKSFLNFLKLHGTISHRFCPYTSQQNGHAECKHRHILDTVRALLIYTSLPYLFGVKLLLLLFTRLIVFFHPLSTTKLFFSAYMGAHLTTFCLKSLVVFVCHSSCP
jgi:hypothetical protein